ncbi:hypothetical protein GGR51DRAFT_270122 [Nemania sp. FL0031]|nr:hypothetical protein GGR51DRAFT_270122 [Nemania sp. FL0031]
MQTEVRGESLIFYSLLARRKKSFVKLIYFSLSATYSLFISPILAIPDQSHDRTKARTASPFRDPSSILNNNVVNYSIFLIFAVASPLSETESLLLWQAAPRAQFNLEDSEADCPIATAMETSYTHGGDADAPSWLADSARAYVRAILNLLRALRQNGSSGGSSCAMQSTGMAKLGSGPLILPLI